MEKKTGQYFTYIAGAEWKNGRVIKKLADYQIFQHLDGYHTIGACGGQFMNMFLSFDVDFPDILISKWITQKISSTLTGMGIEHHISFSGKKGWHVEIFFEDMVSRTVHENLFNYVLNQSDVRQYFAKSKKIKETMMLEDGRIIELGDVEYRPSEGYGVKVPLGYHQKTKRFCGFCEIDNGLKVMTLQKSYEYFLNIKQINCKEIVTKHFPELLSHTKIDEYVSKEEFSKTEGSISKYVAPKYNLTEDEAITEYTDLLLNGMRYKNSRHNTIFKIAMLLKHNGLEEDDATQKLLVWMDQQPKELYEATKKEADTDIIKSVHDVFKGNYSIKPPKKDIEVLLSEMIAIIDSCPSENEKLLMYATLIHSKRYAPANGVFYFTQDKMAEVTGLAKSTVQILITKLNKLGVLEYVKHNQKYDWDIMRKPRNEYRVILKINPDIVDSRVYITERQDNLDDCLLSFFTIEELKERNIPRRHLERLKQAT